MKIGEWVKDPSMEHPALGIITEVFGDGTAEVEWQTDHGVERILINNLAVWEDGIKIA